MVNSGGANSGGANSGGALAGLKVVDLTRVLGGPYCTMVLADHGAEVIKVEPPQGDETRDWGPPFDDTHDAAYFLGVNRNKRSIALDVSKPAGRAAVLRLLEGADVLTENFKTGTMERWGIGYDALEPLFPRLIHCRVSGFGADGPLGGLAGYDAILQAMVGLMSINGDSSTGPMRMGTALVDMTTGLYSTAAILMAVHERERSGRGQFVDMTLYDCGMSLLHPAAANFLMSGKTPAAAGNAHSNIAPYDSFPTASCNVFLGIGNDGQFRKLAGAIGQPGLATDPRFANNAGRVANRAALSAILVQAFAGEDGHALAIRLAKLGLPVGPVLSVAEALGEPHTAHRRMVAEVEGFRSLGTPIKLSRTPGESLTRPPRFGEHGPAILAEHGYSEADVTALLQDDVLFSERRR